MSNRSGSPEERRSVSERLVRDHLNLTAAADIDAVEANVTSNFFNHRSADEPMDTRKTWARRSKGYKIDWLNQSSLPNDSRFSIQFQIADLGAKLSCLVDSGVMLRWHGRVEQSHLRRANRSRSGGITGGAG
jgi:hypothetical protein